MRYERKYKVDNFQVSAMLQTVRFHPAGFRKIFPDRQVNNIYFDSPHFVCFNDNVAGVAERVKFRVRWYGTLDKVVNPVIEIKIKSNQLGKKLSYPAPEFELSDLSGITRLVRSYNKAGTPLIPVLLNSYNRAYFGTTDKQFRITIDKDLHYRTPQLPAGSVRAAKYVDESVILELKYEEDADHSTDRIMQYLPFRQTKSSKYVTGVNFLFE